jgi:hypothetical protein
MAAEFICWERAWSMVPVVAGMAQCPIAENQRKRLDSGAMRSCVVSYLDVSGIRHTVEVAADSLWQEGP